MPGGFSAIVGAKLSYPLRFKNRLLNALPAETPIRLKPHLEPVELPLGQVLYEPGYRVQYVYFPCDAIVSLLYVMESGASAEISIVGNEGMIGVAVFMGGERTPSRAIVQSRGRALRLPRQRLKDEFDHYGDLMHLLLDMLGGAARDRLLEVSDHVDLPFGSVGIQRHAVIALTAVSAERT